MANPEHAWLQAYRQGDIEALGRLVEHFRRPLFAYILRMTEGRDDAEEIFQEVWFRALRKMDSFDDRKFLSWLFRIAHNLVIDRARKARPQVDLHPPDDEGGDPLETRVASPAPGPDAASAGRDTGLRIRSALSALPVEQREVFLMRTEAELPFKEIARIQGTSINTALARMQYALSKLRVELRTEYEAATGVRP